MALTICCISDTHFEHEKLTNIMPSADLLVVAGDFSAYGKMSEIMTFNHWLGKIKHLYSEIVVVPGNHDPQCKDFYNAQTLMPNATILFNNEYMFKGYKIYGSPHTKVFGRWHYMMNEQEIEQNWKYIPDDTNILITHQPPHMILDEVYHSEKNVGCKYLRYEVLGRLNKLKCHVFGHLHLCGGQVEEQNKVKFVNAAMVDESYCLIRRPVLITID